MSTWKTGELDQFLEAGGVTVPPIGVKGKGAPKLAKPKVPVTLFRYTLEARHEAGLAPVPMADVRDQTVPQVRSASSEVAFAAEILATRRSSSRIFTKRSMTDSRPAPSATTMALWCQLSRSVDGTSP